MPPPPIWRALAAATAAVVILTLCVQCDAKICGYLRLQNTIADMKMLENCTIVTGSLELVLMDKVKNDTDWEAYSFPELVEIWDFLLVYKIKGLRSLNKLFPNLRLIRGIKTLYSHAVVIFTMEDLQEIGLKSLQKIERGKVMIGRCEKLHYYETIDWKGLGTEMDYQFMPPLEQLPCATECNGFCWSQNECQKFSNINFCTKEYGCTEKCPPNKVRLRLSYECITRDECHQIEPKHPWIVFNNTCTNKCPRRYEQLPDSCKFCGDKCEHICPGYEVKTLSILSNLEQCTHINGSLRLKIEDEAIAKELPKYLGEIREIWGYLKITRSSAIKSLEFLKKLELIKGETLDDKNNSLVVIENRNLRKLWTFDENFKLKISAGLFRFHFNPQLDYRDIEQLNNLTIKSNLTSAMVSRESNGDQRRELNLQLSFHIEPTNVTLTWRGRDETSIHEYYYYIYYIENEEIDNIEEDVCTSNAWNVKITSDNFYTLVGLKAFTNYTLYIVQTISSDKQQRKTVSYPFKTASGDPSVPRNVETFSHNGTAIKLSWDPPAEKRGELQSYIITYYKVLSEGSTLKSRDYCKHPVSSGYRGIPLKEEWNPRREVVPSTDGSCECPATSNPNKRDVGNDHIFISTQFDFSEKMNMLVQDKSRYLYFSDDEDQSDSMVTVPADQNSTIITGLDHFSTYMFYISACNKNRTLAPQCSEILMVYNRTSPLANADDLSDYTLVETKEGVNLNWTNPLRPNSPILSYTIHWKGESSSNLLCVLPTELKSYGYQLHLLPGKYEVRVRAVTLAGAGNYTVFKSSFIAHPSGDSTSSWAIGLIMAVVACFLLAAGVWFFCYRRQQKLENARLIQSVNPDYCGSTYVEDEWEIDREDVDIKESLGKGTFGTVYSGYLISRQLPCAVKTVNLSSTYEEKMQFLNEASVMKTFSNTHHVVRLLGVVSRAEIPLVIMELMACGDLKSFLRRNRDSSQTIGCNEMYRMAIEIADGMAYLSAKKFVHRDLAARNCMVAGDHTIKIGDFGMARDIYETDYYRKESQGLLPVRWMAPESLADGVFTTDSDIWSYGIVLWEMVTLAEQPYQGLGNADVWQFVITKGRMNRPPECPDLLYEIMDVCWRWQPSKRPQFVDIVHKLERHVSEDFKLMSFYHSREGQEHLLNARERPFNPPAMAQASRGSKNAFAHYHRSDENIGLYSDEQDPINYPSNPKQRSNLLSDYADEEDNPGSNGYASLSKTPEGF